MAPDVLVVGAGVVGLTTAVRLAEAGLRVRVRAAAPPGQSTSAVAGAIWGLHLIDTDARLADLGWRTLAVLREHAADPASGVRMVSGIEVAHTAATPADWTAALDDFRLCSPAELPDGYASGWRYTAPLADMPVYLDYLTRRLVDAGVEVELGAASTLGGPLTVNCTGVGARELVPDPEVVPVRGQVVVLDNPGLHEFFTEHPGSSEHLLYILPHREHVLVGGTAEPGRVELDPDPDTAAAILERATAAVPLLRGATVRGHRVGLRPGRPALRLERDGDVIHNYGHGGAGVSLSWACADEVLRLISA